MHLKNHRGRFGAAVAATLIGVMGIGAHAANAAPTWLGPAQLSSATICASLSVEPNVIGKPAETAVMTPDGTGVAAWTRGDGACAGPTRIEVSVLPPKSAAVGPTVISNTTLEASGPKLAVDANGTVIAVWQEGATIRYSLRPAGGTFSPAQTVGVADPLVPAEPDVAIAGGNAVVGWTTGIDTEVAIKPSGDPFGLPTGFATPTETSKSADVAINASGAALVSWQTLGLTLDTLHAAARPPGGAFNQLNLVFATTADLDNITAPLVDIDPQGRGTLLWSYNDSASTIHRVLSASRAATGNFGAVQTLSDPAVDSGSLGSIGLAVDSDGRAIATWWTAATVQSAVKPPDGAFGARIPTNSATNFVITPPQVRFDPSGRAIVAWLSPGGLTYQVQSSILQKGSTSFGPIAVAQSIPAAAGDRIDGVTPLGVDDQGNAFTVWRRKFDGDPVAPGFQQTFVVQGSALDAVGPTLGPISVPSNGPNGSPVDVSVGQPVDRLSAVASVTWSFGDGGTASGLSPSHTYRRGGTYTVTVTATDAVGNDTSESRTIQIPSVPGDGSADGVIGSGGGNGGPAITGLRLSRTVFRAARSGPTVKPSAAALRFFTRVSYSVAAAAKVRFTFERPRAGRRSGSRCAKPARSNRRGKACIRYIPVKGSFRRTRPRGGDRFTFTGRLLGHRLPAGHYRMSVVAFAGSLHGNTARASLRIRH